MPSPASLLVFGEVLWDIFDDAEFIGGAPFNLAAHAVRCGLPAFFYSRVGGDARGRAARAAAEGFGIGTEWLQADSALPTGWVRVRLDADGQPSYEVGEPVAWDAIAAPGTEEEKRLAAAGFSALVCGTLAQRSPGSRDALAAIRRALPGVPVVYDVNLRPPFTPLATVRATFPGTTVVKVNRDEADLLSRELWGLPFSPSDFFRRMRRDFGTAYVLVTCGAEGASLLGVEGEIAIPAVRAEVASAVGAGDAFLAAFLAGWLRGLPLPEAGRLASRLGAWVVSRPEAVPDYPDDLRRSLLGMSR